MSETDIIRVGAPLPCVGTVRPLDDLEVEVGWLTGGKQTIYLAPAIFTFKIYRPLRDDPDLFKKVHTINGGSAIAWDEAIDMSAVMLADLANQTMEVADFRSFLERNKLTLDAAAAQLGISRRLAAYYAAGDKPIPRTVALACRYLDEKLGGGSRPKRPTYGGSVATKHTIKKGAAKKGVAGKKVAMKRSARRIAGKKITRSRFASG
jgi:hypothetical protein